LKQGSTGEPVKLLKRALRAAGLLPGKGKPTGYLGPFARRALVKLGQARTLPAAKHGGPPRHGLRAFKTGGIYGPRAHVKLAPYYDAYGAARLRAIARARQLAAIQAAGIAACNLVIRNRGAIHYTQTSLRMSGVRHGLVPPQYGHWEDCSSEATWIAYVMDRVARRMGGRYPDPNGLGYSGVGYTGTLTRNGIPVSAYGGKPAFTFVFYGWPIGHVTVKTSMAYCMSHGSERGPRAEPVGYRTPVAARYYPPRLPA
jgi:peptidoglycan hydrolase-like protein with peptidoglycan-binding domain